MNKIKENDIAIIGMACRFPMANSLKEFWENLKAGKTSFRKPSISRIQDWKPFFGEIVNDLPPLGYLEEINQFDPHFFDIAPGEASYIDPAQRLLLETVGHVFQTSGYRNDQLSRIPTGVFISCGNSGYKELIHIDDYSVAAEVGNLPSVSAGRISYTYKLNGPSLIIDTACSSSLVALYYACESLLRKDCEMALLGSVNVHAFLDEKIGGFEPGKENIQFPHQVSEDDPNFVENIFANRCRFFDKAADGVSNGEGVGALLLKPLKQAILEDDIIHAVIKGSAINHNAGRTSTLSGHKVEPQVEVMKKALSRANIDALTLSYLEASGTATELGDPIEIDSISQVFSQYTDKKEICPIGCVKANIGHLNHTSGLASIIKIVLALQHRQIPPLARFNEANPHIDFKNSPVFVNTELMDWELKKEQGSIRRAGINSFSVNGSNSHVILEEAPNISHPFVSKTLISNNMKGIKEMTSQQAKDFKNQNNHHHLLTFSAKNTESLKKVYEKIRVEILESCEEFDNSEDTSNLVHMQQKISDICYSMNVKRDHYDHRLALIFKNKQELIDGLKNSFSDIVEINKIPSDSQFFKGFPPRTKEPLINKAVFLFPGECDLMAERYEDFRKKGFLATKYLEECANIPSIPRNRRFFSFSFQYALAKFWIDLGIRPSFVLGFGIGKYVSKVISNQISLKEALNMCFDDDNHNTFNKEKFKENIQLLYSKGQKLFLEIGMPNQLGEISRGYLEGKPDAYILSSYDYQEKEKGLLNTIAWLYTQGITMDFSNLFPGNLILMPGYPYDRKKYWVTPPKDKEYPNDIFVDSSSGPKEFQTNQDSNSQLLRLQKFDNREVEQLLIDTVKEFFGVEGLTLEDDFFQLGGDSLKAMILLSKLHRIFQVNIPLKVLFERSRLFELALYIKHANKQESKTILPAEDREYYPLSSAQKRLFILKKIDEKGLGYNILWLSILKGKLNIEEIEKAFKKLIQRHESLRTSFRMFNGEPIQRIHSFKDIEFGLEYFDNHSIFTSPEPIIKDFNQPFKFTDAPLFRVRLINFSNDSENNQNSVQANIEKGIINDQFILMVNMHHIISDGASMSILIKDFLSFYRNENAQPLRIQYRDFSQWQNSPEVGREIKQQKEFWLKEFSGEIPILTLPTDSKRPTLLGAEGHTLDFEIDLEISNKIKKMALEEGVTVFMILMGIFKIFLSKLSNQSDIVVGIPIAGRHHSDLDSITGMFVNTLALRNFIDRGKSFEEILGDIKTHTLEIFSNQDYPYEELVENLKVPRDTSRNPLFDVMFILQNNEKTEIEISDLKLIPYPYQSGISRFDLTLEIQEQRNIFWCQLEFSTHLFSNETIQRFIQYFQHILSSVVGEPQKKLSHISMIPEEEKHLILEQFNRTHNDCPKEQTVVELYEAQVEKSPHLRAIGFENQQMTYQYLNQLSNQLSAFLIEKGVREDFLLPIIVDRSLEMMIGIFGILKAGGAYVPIDPITPPQRIAYIMNDINKKLLLSPYPLKSVVDDHYECLDISGQKWRNTNNENPKKVITPENLVYATFTSGSTGKPKGVLIQHRSLLNIIWELNRKYALNETEKYLLKTSIAFDVSKTELFGWFLNSGNLTLLKNGDEKIPRQILNAIIKNHITHINFVPSMFNVFLDFLKSKKSEDLFCLKYIFLAGEALTIDMVAEFYKLQISAQLENLYGPTETTIYASGYSLNRWDKNKTIPIGKPLGNMSLYILDYSLQLQPIGVPGELMISGVGVSRGYLNHPELSVEKFVNFCINKYKYIKEFLSIPFPTYKTGDLARWSSDGNIEFLGRMDSQVKIRGFRIELGEIEAQLHKNKYIKEVVVLMHPKDLRKNNIANVENYENQIYAYIVIEGELNTSELKDYLSKELPEYMIPSSFVRVDKIPKLENGKINRKALVTSGTRLKSGVEFVAPQNEIEEKISQVWKEMLNIDQVSVHENFFDLGGTSLDIIKVNERMMEIFDIGESVLPMFRFTTIRSFAEFVGREKNISAVNAQASFRTIPVERSAKIRANQKIKRKRGRNLNGNE